MDSQVLSWHEARALISSLAVGTDKTILITSGVTLYLPVFCW